jgi:hypothetical protein
MIIIGVETGGLMDRPVKQGTKQPYSLPLLTVYGTIQEVTRTVGRHGNHASG